MASEAYRQAQARWEMHHAECWAAHIAQYQAVQDYAAWRFQSLPPDTSCQDVSALLSVVDFESLRTIQDVDAA